MAPTSVKQGDAVVYSINGKEYAGVALGSASVGQHPGLARPSVHLNLTYLNEQGTAIKIFGAPLLTEAYDDDSLEKVAEILDRVKPNFVGNRRVVDVNAAKESLTAAKVTIGWKPAEEGAAEKALRESLAAARTQVTELTAQVAQANADAAASKKAAADAQAQVASLQAQVKELEAHAASLVEAAKTPAPDEEDAGAGGDDKQGDGAAAD